MSNEDNRGTASEHDVATGSAVFSIPERRSRIYDLGVALPVRGRLRRDVDTGQDSATLPRGTEVTVVQAEIVDEKDVLIGFRVGETSFVCLLEEIQIEE
jgi:hypothetical protein